MKPSRKLTLLSLGLVALGLFGIAAVQAAPLTPTSLTIPAGQSATVRVNVFCLDFGKDFPAGQNIQPSGTADPRLVSALSYAVDKGYDQSQPNQVQLALWYLRDNTWHNQSGENTTVAQEIVNAAGSGSSAATPTTTVSGTTTVVTGTITPGTVPVTGTVSPSDITSTAGITGTNTGLTTAAGATTVSGSGTDLVNAVKGGNVKVTATGLQPLSQGQYYGTSVLQIQNTGANSFSLNFAPGTTFTAPGSNFQTLIAYATGQQTSAAPAATEEVTTSSGNAQVTTATTVTATTTADGTATVTTTAGTPGTTTTGATASPSANATTLTASPIAAIASPTPDPNASAGFPNTGTGGNSSPQGFGVGALLLVALLAGIALLAWTGLSMRKKPRG